MSCQMPHLGNRCLRWDYEAGRHGLREQNESVKYVTDYGSIKVKVMGKGVIRLFNFRMAYIPVFEMTVLWGKEMRYFPDA